MSVSGAIQPVSAISSLEPAQNSPELIYEYVEGGFYFSDAHSARTHEFVSLPGLTQIQVQELIEGKKHFSPPENPDESFLFCFGWPVGQYKVGIVAENGVLFCTTYDETDKILHDEKIRQIDDNGKSLPAGEIYCKYSQLTPSVGDQWKATFFSCEHEIRASSASEETRYIQLLKNAENAELVWQLKDNRTAQTHQFPVQQYQDKPLKDRVRLLKTRTAEQILESNHTTSCIDTKRAIDANQCALTLLCVGIRSNPSSTSSGVCSSQYGSGENWYGHAVIALEGIEDGFPYIRYFDLVPDKDPVTRKIKSNVGIIRISGKEKDQEFPNYNYKSETWIRPAELGEKIEARIRWEQAQQEQGTPWVFFDEKGSDSRITKRVLVKSFETQQDYESYMKDIPPGTNPERIELDGTDPMGIFFYFFDAPFYYPPTCEHNLEPSKSTIISYEFGKSNYGNRNIQVLKKPDNCMTWARKLLTIANIRLFDKKNFFTTTKEYLTSSPTLSKSAKANERVYLPTRFGSFGYLKNEFDCTDVIQRIVGSQTWRLTEASRNFLDQVSSAHRFEKLPKTVRAQVIGEEKLTLSIEVNGVEKDVDLTHYCKERYLRGFKKEYRKFQLFKNDSLKPLLYPFILAKWSIEDLFTPTKLNSEEKRILEDFKEADISDKKKYVLGEIWDNEM
ncbi:MAG: hypothetical protein K1000chlam3_01160 [Chlamydiae bacterium]|nr:hypothetical protein [Chlamydiota bacterium]